MRANRIGKRYLYQEKYQFCDLTSSVPQNVAIQKKKINKNNNNYNFVSIKLSSKVKRFFFFFFSFFFSYARFVDLNV